jgi:lipoprotein-releasing system permease protein
MFQMVEKQRSVIALLVFLVSLVASLNILSTMFVSVTQKQRDISLLRALGASNRQVLRLFLNQSVIMGFIGVLLGCSLAAFINHLLGNYDFIKLPDAYFLRTLPVKNDPAVYGGVAVVALVLSVIAALGPSLAASRGDPSAGLSEKG